MAEAVLGGLLQVVVDRQLDAAALDRRHLVERADFAAHAVDDDALGAVLAHQQLVVDLLDARLADDVAARMIAVADLRVAGLADVAEQVRGQRVGRILARRHFLDEDVGQLEVETPRGDRRHLRQRRVLDDDDRPIASARRDGDRRSALTCFGSRPATAASSRMVRSRSLVCSRTIEMLKELRFSTSTLPLRSNIDAARRAQRKRPLVVVLRHLLELGVLDDLEEPEADRRARRTRRSTAPTCRHGEANRVIAATIFSHGHES